MYPDPLLMNAFNNVNLAGACILTSTDYARELGIPKDRWIYPLGGAGTSDSKDCTYGCQIHFPSLRYCSLGEIELLFEPRDLKIT
jgi:hypothetical protein